MFNLTTFFDGTQVNFAVAFLAGVITFFASCLLPLVPTYLAYLSGVSLSSSSASSQRWNILRHAALFVAGFISIFMVMGVFSYQLSSVVTAYKPFIQTGAGLLFIALGLFMLGVFQHRWFIQERKLNLQGIFTQHTYIHALLIGSAFGLSWTPCIGPVLAVILYWSAQQASVGQGLFLLLMYGLGLGLPFLVVAVGFEKMIPILRKYQKVSLYTTKISAILIILMGVLLLTGKLQELNFFLLRLFNLSSLSV